jgi:hypothetical protein
MWRFYSINHELYLVMVVFFFFFVFFYLSYYALWPVPIRINLVLWIFVDSW